jgi:hypothetical protein
MTNDTTNTTGTEPTDRERRIRELLAQIPDPQWREAALAAPLDPQFGHIPVELGGAIAHIDWTDPLGLNWYGVAQCIRRNALLPPFPGAKPDAALTAEVERLRGEVADCDEVRRELSAAVAQIEEGDEAYQIIREQLANCRFKLAEVERERDEARAASDQLRELVERLDRDRSVIRDNLAVARARAETAERKLDAVIRLLRTTREVNDALAVLLS